MTELLPCPFCGGEASAEGMSGDNVGCNDAECPGYPINCSSHAWNARAALSAERERAKGLVELLKAWVCMYEDKNEVPGEARVMAWAASIQALAAYEQQCIENAKK